LVSQDADIDEQSKPMRSSAQVACNDGRQSLEVTPKGYGGLGWRGSPFLIPSQDLLIIHLTYSSFPSSPQTQPEVTATKIVDYTRAPLRLITRKQGCSMAWLLKRGSLKGSDFLV
jgi:hypothetical protein